jgi:hypothetical protein
MNATPPTPYEHTTPSPRMPSATRLAIEQGVPLFLDGDIARSSPGNASPYMLSESAFYRIYAVGDARRARADGFRSAITALETHCQFHAALIGGSMLDLGNDAPRDLDAVVFYAAKEATSSEEIATFLASLTEDAKTHSVDLRFVPTDASPLITIKAACYFAMLYASDRANAAARKGALLVTRGH